MYLIREWWKELTIVLTVVAFFAALMNGKSPPDLKSSFFAFIAVAGVAIVGVMCAVVQVRKKRINAHSFDAFIERPSTVMRLTFAAMAGLAAVGLMLVTHAPFEVGWLAIIAFVMLGTFTLTSAQRVRARGSTWLQVVIDFVGQRTYAVP